MARKLSVDKCLFGVTVALVVVGVIMVFSASAVLANDKFHSPLYFLLRQGVWALLGLAILVDGLHNLAALLVCVY